MGSVLSARLGDLQPAVEDALLTALGKHLHAQYARGVQQYSMRMQGFCAGDHNTYCVKVKSSESFVTFLVLALKGNTRYSFFPFSGKSKHLWKTVGV